MINCTPSAVLSGINYALKSLNVYTNAVERSVIIYESVLRKRLNQLITQLFIDPSNAIRKKISFIPRVI